MPLRQLAKSQWQAYFDRVSVALAAKRAEVEVAGLGLGDQTEADQLPLIGLTYEPARDLLTVALEGIQHLIHHPREIHIDHELDWLQRVEVTDREGNLHIVTLDEPLALPAP